jgi:hypothetical protein
VFDGCTNCEVPFGVCRCELQPDLLAFVQLCSSLQGDSRLTEVVGIGLVSLNRCKQLDWELSSEPRMSPFALFPNLAAADPVLVVCCCEAANGIVPCGVRFTPESFPRRSRIDKAPR